MKDFWEGLTLTILGVGALIFRQLVLPKIAVKIAEQQYQLISKLFGNRLSHLVKMNYERGARLGLLLAGLAFVIIGLFQLVAVLFRK